MFATSFNPARDPVRLYQVYASKRPASYSDPQDPFYIAPRTVPVSSLDDQWFLKSPVGEKNISGIMKNMAIQGELDISKRLTNHCARKHLVQKLRDAGVAPTTIMQVSGHRNVQSVLNYSEMPETEQINCSNILSTSNPVRAPFASENPVPQNQCCQHTLCPWRPLLQKRVFGMFIQNSPLQTVCRQPNPQQPNLKIKAVSVMGKVIYCNQCLLEPLSISKISICIWSEHSCNQCMTGDHVIRVETKYFGAFLQSSRK